MLNAESQAGKLKAEKSDAWEQPYVGTDCRRPRHAPRAIGPHGDWLARARAALGRTAAMPGLVCAMPAIAVTDCWFAAANWAAPLVCYARRKGMVSRASGELTDASGISRRQRGRAGSTCIILLGSSTVLFASVVKIPELFSS